MNPEISSRSGFTLLEMMLSVGVFILLITAAFSLVGATSELMTEVSEAQNQAAIRIRVVETVREA
ncbi:MAG: prepilin-type N-terminal cleavage/methylation domain-containing protein, partial [Verrucomicrobiota bacterium]